jgi:Cu-processing system permease protein
MTPGLQGAVWICARQDLRLALRSRWIQTFTVVFAVLALAVASSGYVLTGGSGLQDFARTSASLVQLVLLLVPLTALVVGVQTLTTEAGAAELLFSQPVARRTILGGRLLGIFIGLLAAQSIGFGAAGLVLSLRTGEAGIAGFLAVVAGSIALTAIFLGIAALVASGDAGHRRARSLATALVVWFVAVMLFDIAVLGAASLLRSGPASRLIIIAAIVNPVDAVRTAMLLLIEGPAAFGAASLALLRFAGGATGAAIWIGVSVLVWLVAPLALAIARLNRADI